ncbi:hypothetical protein [Sulfurisphaera ohwakuensis]|uniref:SDH family Clp fold serine proteinase n=1 Tax=Sulfurisphaera ohwakuensis TaxID=69656 RepID=UPI0036F1C997
MEDIAQRLRKIDSLISEYEGKKSDVAAILLAYHTGSFSSTPISKQDVEVIYTFLKNKKKELEGTNIKEFHVILHSFGGDPDAAYQISRLIDRIVEPSVSIVYCIPRFAKSAATLMALGGDKIVMTEIAELGPIDPQIYFEGQWVSAKTVRSSLRYMVETLLDLLEKRSSKSNLPNLQQAIDSIINNIVGRFVGIGEYESLIDYIKQLAKDLITLRMFKGAGEQKIDDIINNLIMAYSSHEMVIDYQKAQQLGLKVEKTSDTDEEKLLQIYSELNDLFKYIDTLGAGLSEQLNVQYIPSYPWNIDDGIIFLPFPRE